ncbi:hypothetical protein Patl1_11374 [Pistacia atlantica]|uniref:Uncharacterized protein n=1 Tax=Pistacia atlantica TaxID=434234 RepID=A0ACC1A4P3_9ROSI|nr:hypothetical protein Patl1_11374 [Pistacia atlantica]
MRTFSNYMCYPAAKELWDSVVEMYSDLENQSQIYELQQKVGEIQQGEGNVSKYFNALKGLWQDLDLNHHKKTVESARIFKFLAGLNVEFDEVRRRILGKQPLPSIGEVFSEVRREESSRSIMLGQKGIAGSRSTENSALVTINSVENSSCCKPITIQQPKPVKAL